MRSEALDILQSRTSVPLIERRRSNGLIRASRAVIDSGSISTIYIPGAGQLPLILDQSDHQ